MPSDKYKSRRYGPAKESSVNSGTNTTPYGPGAHDHHPPLPVTPDFRDDTRAAEPGGLRGFYDIRNWTKRVDQSALDNLRRAFLQPTITSK